jgi:hypothetical protein
MAEEDNVDGEDWEVGGERPHGRVPQLHRNEEDIRQTLIGNENHGRRSSPMSGGRQLHDPAWRMEEWSSSCKSGGKRTVRSQGVFMREELASDGRR